MRTTESPDCKCSSSGSSHFELVYPNDTSYEGWIDFRFTLVYKDVLVIT